VTVLAIARRLASVLGVGIPKVTHKYRAGDIRHCFADTALAGDLLGHKPQVRLDEGMAQLADWLEGQVAVDRVDAATSELAARGLTR
jgi:dTDP-L-rhamnose 4-epimerase